MGTNDHPIKTKQSRSAAIRRRLQSTVSQCDSFWSCMPKIQFNLMHIKYKLDETLASSYLECFTYSGWTAYTYHRAETWDYRVCFSTPQEHHLNCSLTHKLQVYILLPTAAVWRKKNAKDPGHEVLLLKYLFIELHLAEHIEIFWRPLRLSILLVNLWEVATVAVYCTAEENLTGLTT